MENGEPGEEAQPPRAPSSRKHCARVGSHPPAHPPSQPERIKHLLDNVELGSGKASMAEKTEGMKYILAVRDPTPVHARQRAAASLPLVSRVQSMARGRDVSVFYPDVVRNVIVSVAPRRARGRACVV